MSSTEWLQLRHTLNSRRDTVADGWYAAVKHTGHTAFPVAQVRQRIDQLTERLITLLQAEPFDPQAAQALGAALVDLHYISPEALRQTQVVLARQLCAGLSADQIAALEPRLTALLGELAAGFFEQARERILAEQEQIRSALVAELQRRGEALKKLYQEVEQRVQERTAELVAVNVQLEQEIRERKQVEEDLKQHREHLEELVQERTVELAAAKEQALEARRIAESNAQAAEAANRAKSAFLASMSHELRTPLNAILGYAQVLQRRPSVDPNAIDGLRVIESKGMHLLTLINDVMDIVSIETGKLQLRPAPFHFLNFLDHIASIVYSRADVKGLAFTFEKSSTLPTWVQADEMRLRQVLLILLDNAVKFTDEGQVTLRVESKGREQSTEPLLPTTRFVSLLRFEVQDTGIGISPDHQERIFEPFEQAEDVTRWTEGTGLGLPISRQLVRLMGGELHVESPAFTSPQRSWTQAAPPALASRSAAEWIAGGTAQRPEAKRGTEGGPGSIFWFEVALPVVEVAVEVTHPPAPAIIGYRGPRRVVLVVDDLPSHRALIVDLLRPLGFDVLEAADGQQAILLAQKMRPDLILMDRWMPVLDGLEAARRMRRMPELAGVPIVGISASVSEEDQALSREAGLDALLPKPIDWPHLETLLEEQLGLEWESVAPARGAGDGEESRRVREDKEEGAAALVPPRAELAILHDLALMGNMRAIRERAAHIEKLGEQYVPWASKLRQLAEGFEERQILALIERCMEAE